MARGHKGLMLALYKEKLDTLSHIFHLKRATLLMRMSQSCVRLPMSRPTGRKAAETQREEDLKGLLNRNRN